MKPNFDNYSNIKGLKFFKKEICPLYCCFLHTKNDSGGASIHRIDESFPLEPTLIETSEIWRSLINLVLWQGNDFYSMTILSCEHADKFRFALYSKLFKSNEWGFNSLVHKCN